MLADRDFTDGKLRITYTGGAGPLGSQARVRAADAGGRRRGRSRRPPPTTADRHGAVAPQRARRADRGEVHLVRGERPRPGLRGRRTGAAEAIFLNTAGNVCEGTGTNIFCVFGDTVVTPPLELGPLAGITRELLLEWCEIIERDLTLTEALAPTRSSSPRRCVTCRVSTGGTTRSSTPNGRVRSESAARSPSAPEPISIRSSTKIMFGTRRLDEIWFSTPCGAAAWGDWRSGSALRSHRRGHWFEPSIAHQ